MKIKKRKKININLKGDMEREDEGEKGGEKERGSGKAEKVR